MSSGGFYLNITKQDADLRFQTTFFQTFSCSPEFQSITLLHRPLNIIWQMNRMGIGSSFHISLTTPANSITLNPTKRNRLRRTFLILILIYATNNLLTFCTVAQLTSQSFAVLLTDVPRFNSLITLLYWSARSSVLFPLPLGLPNPLRPFLAI